MDMPLTLCLAILLPVAGFAQMSSASAKRRVIILCTGNSARSQMAEGFLRSFDSSLEVYSAGTDPAPRVNPFAVQVMKEVGIDISAGKPKAVDQFTGQPFDFVVTVCGDADQNCPTFRGKVGKRLHIGFPDPARATGTDAEKLAVFRTVRDDIQAKFKDFYQKELRRRS
ncbi:MAG: arsenate reductase ArsC [Bryobacteraceae bacterium]|nr:arsenate reductase ArsC [Bryobacteraceae bacterium]